MPPSGGSRRKSKSLRGHPKSSQLAQSKKLLWNKLNKPNSKNKKEADHLTISVIINGGRS